MGTDPKNSVTPEKDAKASVPGPPRKGSKKGKLQSADGSKMSTTSKGSTTKDGQAPKKSGAQTSGAKKTSNDPKVSGASASKKKTTSKKDSGAARQSDTDVTNSIKSSAASKPSMAAAPGKSFDFSREDLIAGGDYIGMYRNIHPSGVGRLAPHHKAFARFHPWRPKGNIFITTGYYLDMDMGGVGYGLKPNEVMIHNIPLGMSESQIRKEFPEAKYVQLNSDGSVKLEFANAPAAERAYRETDLVKLGNRHLGWKNPEEVYLVGIPPEMTAADLKNDYPNSESVSFIDYPGARRTAVIKFKNVEEADKGFQKSPYKKIGDHQNLYDIEDNPIRLLHLPPNVNEEDLRKKFPGAKDIHVDPDSGQATINYGNSDEARKAYNDADFVHLGKPKLGWLAPEEMAIEDIPINAAGADIKKEFPNSTETILQESDGGRRSAIIRFANEDERKKAYNSSRHKKLGPQRLGYAGSKPIKVEKEKPDPNTQLKIKGIPKGMSASELKKKFPGAQDATVDGQGNAVIQFKNAQDSQRAYNESDMAHLKNKTLGYIKPNQLVIEGVPTKLTEADIRKQFPQATKVSLQPGNDGKNVAIIDFPDEDALNNSLQNTFHPKVGPQRMVYDEKAVGGDPEKQLKIQNVPKDMTESELKKKFPKATRVAIEKGGNATVYFGSTADADDDYKNSAMGKLGSKNLAFLDPNELAVGGLPDSGASNKKIKENLPDAKNIHWITGPDKKTKLAIVRFKDPKVREDNYNNTKLPKTGPQSLDATYGGKGELNLEGLDDMEVARKLWKFQGVEGFSNISNLFSASIKLTNLPPTTKGVDLIKMFDDCKKCDFKGTGKGRAAILEFDNPRSASKAYQKATGMKIEGKAIKVAVVPLKKGKGGGGGGAKTPSQSQSTVGTGSKKSGAVK